MKTQRRPGQIYQAVTLAPLLKKRFEKVLSFDNQIASVVIRAWIDQALNNEMLSPELLTKCKDRSFHRSLASPTAKIQYLLDEQKADNFAKKCVAEGVTKALFIRTFIYLHCQAREVEIPQSVKKPKVSEVDVRLLRVRTGPLDVEKLTQLANASGHNTGTLIASWIKNYAEGCEPWGEQATCKSPSATTGDIENKTAKSLRSSVPMETYARAHARSQSEGRSLIGSISLWIDQYVANSVQKDPNHSIYPNGRKIKNTMPPVSGGALDGLVTIPMPRGLKDEFANAAKATGTNPATMLRNWILLLRDDKHRGCPQVTHQAVIDCGSTAADWDVQLKARVNKTDISKAISVASQHRTSISKLARNWIQAFIALNKA